MNDRIVELFQSGISLLGGESEMSIADVQILRAMLAQGFYSFAEKNKRRTSNIDDYEWMRKQAEKMGVNQ